MFVRLALVCVLALLVAACSPDTNQRRARADDIKGPQPLWAVNYVRGVREQDELVNEQRAVLTWLAMMDTGRWTLGSDLTRLSADLARCPGPLKELAASSTAHARDGLRAKPINEVASYQTVNEDGGQGGPPGQIAQEVRVKGDEALLQAAFHVSRADWFVRRAAQTQLASHCDAARADIGEARDALARIDGLAAEAMRMAGAFQ